MPLKAPGVVAVYKANDIPGIDDWGYTFPYPLLAFEKVRFQGEGVALVAAENPDQAEEAAELVDVRYETKTRECCEDDSPNL